MVKGNQRGSAVIAAVVVALVVISLLGAGLTISLYYQNASLENHAKRQAYLNARSICDSLAIEMQGSDASSYLPSSLTDSVPLTDITINGISGTATGKVTYDQNYIDKNVINISITATYNKQSSTVVLKMKKQNNQWYKNNYSGSVK